MPKIQIRNSKLTSKRYEEKAQNVKCVVRVQTNSLAALTSSGCFFCCFITEEVGFDFSVFVSGCTALLFTGTEAGLVEDFGADFLYMDVGFFPVPKKAAPTKILGLGFRLLKVMVIAFLDSAGLALLAGAVVVVATGLAATLLN